MEWVIVPVGVGTLITALIGLLKIAGVVKEGLGGKWALGANIIVAALLTFAVEVFEFDMSGDLATQVAEVAGLLGQLLLSLVGSYTSHYLSKRMDTYDPEQTGANARRSETGHK